MEKTTVATPSLNPARPDVRHTTRRPPPAAGLWAALLFAGLLVGCASLKKGADAVYVVSIHEFARPDIIPGRSILLLTDYSGTQRVAVKRMPLLSSHSIVSGEILEPDSESPDPGVRFRLDQHGSNMWLQACKMLPGAPVAVVVDGFYAFTMRVPIRAPDPRTVDIRGPWSPQETEKIAAEAETNYDSLTGKSIVTNPW